MEFIKVCKETENLPYGALFTKKEIDRVKARFKKTRDVSDFGMLSDIRRFGALVEVSKRKTYFFFGIRFEMKDELTPLAN